MDNQVVEVKTAAMAVGKSPQVLVTSGIGSCVALCLYDKIEKVGALIHIMLPSSNRDTRNPYRSADTGVAKVLSELENIGVKRQDLEAKIVGGAHMFRALGQNPRDLGSRNVEAVEDILKENGIKVSSEDVGGSVGRSLEFSLGSGVVKVTTKM